VQTPGNVARGEAMRSARLRRWVIIIGVVAIVANAAAATYDAWRSYRQLMRDATRELSNVAQILASQLEGSLRTVDVLLRDTVDWYRRDGGVSERGVVDTALAMRAQTLPQLLALTITDADGIEQYRSRFNGIQGSLNERDRDDFIAQRDGPNRGLVVSEPFELGPSHARVIALSRRLTDSTGRFAGVVTGFVDLQQFQRFYRQVNLGTQASIFLRHDSGSVVVQEPPVPAGDPDSVLPAVPSQPREFSFVFTSPVDGSRRLVAGSHSPDFPLHLGVSRQETAVLGPWRSEAVSVAVRTLLMTVLGLFTVGGLVYQLRRVERGEQALRESEERYALAMAGANEGHFAWSFDGPSFVSLKMNELLGLPPDIHATTRDEMLVNVHPEDLPRMQAALHDHREGRTDRYEVEYRVRYPDGEWHWLHVRSQFACDDAGKPVRLVGSAMDVTARKKAEEEKERLEEKLRKSQKMEAIGTLAGGIAHDFNNILGAILGFGELAQKNVAEGSAVRRYIDNVMHAGGREKALVERILAFSRTAVGRRSPVNVQAVVSETLELLSASIPAAVSLRQALHAGDAAVIGDATQIHQVVMNLCTNAVQAMPDGGDLTVELRDIQIGEPRSLSHGELRAGRYVVLTVRDTGTGIKREALERMFDPFFTTKEVGVGTGLGLSMVDGIVSGAGGVIDVVSALGTGTTFTVWLPASGSAPAPEAPSGEDLPRGEGQVVMVVDDEPALVSLAEETLAELGYEPAGYPSSAAALKEFARDPGRFDLVLSDEMMPELSGTALARELRRLRPDIPIVIMSGYVDSTAALLARSAGVSEVLRKPLKGRDLAESLARVLRASIETRSAVS